MSDGNPDQGRPQTAAEQDVYARVASAAATRRAGSSPLSGSGASAASGPGERSPDAEARASDRETTSVQPAVKDTAAGGDDPTAAPGAGERTGWKARLGDFTGRMSNKVGQVTGADPVTEPMTAAAGGAPTAPAKPAGAAVARTGDSGPTGAAVTASAAASAAAARISAATRPKVGAGHRTRKARLRLARVDPWSVMKTAFLFSIAAGIMLVVGVYALWSVIAGSGLFANVNEVIASVVSTPGDTTPFRVEDYVNTPKVMGVTAFLACVDVVIITALATLGAFLYNLAAIMLGGLEVTLAED